PFMSDDVTVPQPGFRIDGLTHCSQQAQAVELVASRPLLAPLDKRANRSGRGVEDADLVPVNDSPKAVGLGKVRRALVHQCSGTVLQRAIDDVAMAGHP